MTSKAAKSHQDHAVCSCTGTVYSVHGYVVHTGVPLQYCTGTRGTVQLLSCTTVVTPQRARDCTSLYGDAKLRQTSTLNFAIFFAPLSFQRVAAIMHACSSTKHRHLLAWHMRRARHVVTASDRDAGSQQSLAAQGVHVQCSARSWSRRRRGRSALAITCRVPLNSGCCQLRAACRRHHNGSSDELSASLWKCGGDRQRRLQRRHGRWSRAGI